MSGCGNTTGTMCGRGLRSNTNFGLFEQFVESQEVRIREPVLRPRADHQARDAALDLKLNVILVHELVITDRANRGRSGWFGSG